MAELLDGLRLRAIYDVPLKGAVKASDQPETALDKEVFARVVEYIKDNIAKAKPTPDGGAEDGASPAPPTEGGDPPEEVEFVVAVPGTVKVMITRDAHTKFRAHMQFIPQTSSETAVLPPERLLAEITATIGVVPPWAPHRAGWEMMSAAVYPPATGDNGLPRGWGFPLLPPTPPAAKEEEEERQ